MRGDPPKISFIIPYYENHELLPQTLSSIDKHCWDVPHEIIIIDDASPTRNYIPNDTNNGPLVIKNASNKGPAVSRNIGITRARGDYIFFLDSDDQLASNPSAMIEGGRSSDLILGRYDSEPTYPLLGKMFPRQTSLSDDPVLIKRQGFWSHAYRRDFLLEKGIQFPEKLRLGEDIVFLARALAQAKCIWMTNQITVHYNNDRLGRITEKGLSSAGIEAAFGQMPFLLMEALDGHPDAFAIQFCMLFSKRLENLRVLSKQSGAKSFETAATHFGRFTKYLHQIADLDEKVSAWKIKWDERKMMLARQLSEANPEDYGHIICAHFDAS